MEKNSKIMITVIAVVLALSIAAVAIAVAVRKGGDDQTTVPESISTVTEATTVQSIDLSKEILGKWVDSTGMSGYDFHSDGTVDVTYVNLTIPVLNIPINGSARGTYSLNGNNLEVHFSIYSGSVDVYYTASVDNNTLTLIDTEDKDTYTYMRPSGNSDVTTETFEQTTSQLKEDSLIGQWKSSDNTVEYVFFENGTVNVKLFGKDSTAEYSGVYIREGSNAITLQYAAADGNVTNTYVYEISGLSMKLTDSNGESTLFIKTAGESQSLIGKWQDSSGMSGYEFREDGVVKITYINLTVPVVNIPISGKIDGTYSINGNSITIGYSSYSNSIRDTYYYTVSGSTLKLVNVSDGEETTYIKVS